MADISKRQLESYIRQAARERGIDPEVAVRVARSEGLGANPAEGWQSNYSRNGRREPSFGPFQLLVGGPGTGYSRGLGNKFMKLTGLHPKNPKSVFKQIDFALNEAIKGGWGAWYGAKKVGVDKWTGLRGARPKEVTTASAAQGMPDNAPLPPLRFKDIAARTVAPTAKSAHTGMSLAQLPVSGNKPLQLASRPGSLPESAPIPTAALRMPDPARFAPGVQVAKAPEPSRERFGYSNAQPAPARYGPASIMNELGIGSAQAAEGPLGPSPKRLASQYAAYGAGKLPPVPTTVTTPTTSRLPAAPMLAQNAMSRPSILGDPQTFSLENAPQPTFVPNPEVLPNMPMQAQPKPVQQRIDEAFTASTAPMPQAPQYTAGDIYGGQVGSALDNTGQNTVSRDAFGGTSVTNKYGAKTITTPDGRQAADLSGLLGGSSPGEGIRGAVRSGAGTMAGGMAGGLLGPVGSILGAVLGHELAKPGGGKVGDFLKSVKTVNTTQGPMQFARPVSGGPFPSAPKAPPGYSNKSTLSAAERDKRGNAISPRANAAIKSGGGGLF